MRNEPHSLRARQMRNQPLHFAGNFDDSPNDANALAKARCRWGGADDSVPTEMVTEYVVCATAPKAMPGLQPLTVALNGQVTSVGHLASAPRA